MTLFEAGGFYRASGERYGIDFLFGIRYFDLGADLTLTPPAPLGRRVVDGSSTLTDGFVGFRYIAPVGESWLFSVRGDAGTGDSDLSLNASAQLGYRFGDDDRYNFLIGYRHLSIEYDETDMFLPVEVDMSMSGPMLGFAFRF